VQRHRINLGDDFANSFCETKRMHETQALVLRKPEAWHSVNLQLGTIDDLGEAAVLRASRWCDYVHLVTTPRQARSKPLGESCGPIDVWAEGVAGDDHPDVSNFARQRVSLSIRGEIWKA